VLATRRGGAGRRLRSPASRLQRAKADEPRSLQGHLARNAWPRSSEDLGRASRVHRLLAGLLEIVRGAAHHEEAERGVRIVCVFWCATRAPYVHCLVRGARAPCASFGARHAHPTCTAWCAEHAHRVRRLVRDTRTLRARQAQPVRRCREASRPSPWCAAAADPVSFAPRGRPRRQGGPG